MGVSFLQPDLIGVRLTADPLISSSGYVVEDILNGFGILAVIGVARQPYGPYGAQPY